MRTARFLTTLALVGASTVVMAGPAAADHFSGLSTDGSICFATGISTGVGYDLRTTDVRVRYAKDGSLRDFTCRFATTPAPDQNWIKPWTDNGPYVVRVMCENEEGDLLEDAGEFRITPNGKATLRCRF